MEKLLLVFSFLEECTLEMELLKNNEDTLRELCRLLREADEQIWKTRHGPRLIALLRFFGILAPYKGQERLDDLDPRLICETLVEFERFRSRLVLF